jgi:two-component system chemotaxis response regulator CheB
MVRVLVVDDSAFMRNAISNMLASDAGIQVVGVARDGLEAIAKVKTLKPDIVTLDVEMPRMDGIQALRHIMSSTPLPVVMVSSLTTAGARVTLEALEAGAVDFIPKNLSDLSVNIVRIKAVLLEKIKALGRRSLPPRVVGAVTAALPEPLPAPDRTAGERRIGVVAIGTSTGGPKAVQGILPRLPKNFPVPIVVAQHMPPAFTGPFAERLDQLCGLRVAEAREAEPLRPGTVLIAPGGGHMRLKRGTALETVVSISEDRQEFVYRPSVDALLTSASEVLPGRVLGVILTGMGDDGLLGARAVREGGGRVFVQSEDTCVVYGMPRAVAEAGLADKVLPVEEIAGEILNAV